MMLCCCSQVPLVFSLRWDEGNRQRGTVCSAALLQSTDRHQNSSTWPGIWVWVRRRRLSWRGASRLVGGINKQILMISTMFPLDLHDGGWWSW